MIYLDYAATAPLSDSVIGYLDTLAQNWMNPSSIYAGGDYNKQMIEKVREKVAEMINAEPEEIIFTSGGSESNALAISGFLQAHPDYAFTPSVIEHSSVLGFFDKERGDIKIPVTPSGEVELAFLKHMKPMFRKRKFKYLVSTMMCNNEIGTYQPIKEICEIAHKNGDIVHVDAVQAFGKIPIDVKYLDVDMLSISGHKIGSIRGVGVLYVKKGVQIKPIICGTQEEGLRGGTYNDLAIKTLGLAIDDVLDDLDAGIQTAIRAKRDYLLNLLKADYRIKLNGNLEIRCASNLNIRIDDCSVSGQQIVELLNEKGICVSAGSACHSGDNKPSHVLKALGLTDEQATNSIRITIGKETTVRELEYFADELFSILNMFEEE